MYQFAAPASAPPDSTRDAPTWFETMTLPALPAIGRRNARTEQRRARWYHDRWFLALVICAICASVSAAVWAYQTHSILLYADAHSHLLIARRIFDNIYPGLAQLGNVWLPLPHMLMAPFAQNDFLWRTGLAGTLTSMPCYLIASIYVFLTARRLTHNSRASFIGSLLFVLNPNILYLQTTPLSETVLFATLAAASYYFVAWAQTDELRDLVAAALATLLATVSRYDGWALFLALIAAIVAHRLAQASTASEDPRGCHPVFHAWRHSGLSCGSSGTSSFSAAPRRFSPGHSRRRRRRRHSSKADIADTYHNLWETLRYYSFAAAESIGPVLFALAALAVIVFLAADASPRGAGRLTRCSFPSLSIVVAFYLGQDVMYVPHATHPPSLTYVQRPLWRRDGGACGGVHGHPG